MSYDATAASSAYELTGRYPGNSEEGRRLGTGLRVDVKVLGQQIYPGFWLLLCNRVDGTTPLHC